jgi:hypothetical protein
VDVLDLQQNCFTTLSARQVMESVVTSGYPDLRYIASLDRGDYLEEIISAGGLFHADEVVLTFDALLKDRNFVRLMRTALMRLEAVYERPVDIEFTVEIVPGYPSPGYRLHLLQCRPLSQREIEESVRIPADLATEDILFSTSGLVPDGKVEGVRYIIFIDPNVYRRIASQPIKLELGRAIGRLNKILERSRFVMMGPGRWGSANIDLGVRVSYADFYNTRALIEISLSTDGGALSLSYGTHFYQDLVEAGIHALPLHLGQARSTFRWEFFRQAPNALASLSAADAELADYLKVIDVPAVAGGRRLTILMDGANDEAAGFLASGEWQDGPRPEGSTSIF